MSTSAQRSRLSVNYLISRYISEHGTDDRDVSPADMIEMLPTAMMRLNVSAVLTERQLEISTEDYEADLPCDFYELLRIELITPGSYQTFDRRRPGTQQHDRHLISGTPDGMKSADLGWNILDHKLLSSNRSQDFYLWYWAVDTDKDGFPTVPDDPMVVEALMWYLRWKEAQRESRPSISQEIQYYEQQWEKYCERARASLHRPDEETMQRLANQQMKIVGPESAYYSRWANAGTRAYENHHGWRY